MKIPQPKYAIGQTIFVFTKEGMTETKVDSISIHIHNDSSCSVCYFVGRNFDHYQESQVYGDANNAKKKLKDNADKLQLSIDLK